MWWSHMYILLNDPSHRWPAPLVTEVQQYDALNYYPAEAYHQNYYAQNPSQGYCQSVVAPKVAKIRAKFMKMLLS